MMALRFIPTIEFAKLIHFWDEHNVWLDGKTICVNFQTLINRNKSYFTSAFFKRCALHM